MREKGVQRTFISILLIMSLLIGGISVPVAADAAETYMVFFDSQGGSYCGYLTDVPENTKITLPKPAREGYIFEGWYTDSDCNSLSAFYSWMPITENMLLYAKWTRKPIAYIKAEYIGEPVIVNTYVEKKNFIVRAYYYDGTSFIVDPEDEELYLTNNLIVNTGTYDYNLVEVHYRDEAVDYVNIKGIKEPIYCIGFDSMGGTFVAPITGIAPGAYVQLPTNPTREGYKFDGWYMEKTYKTKFTAQTAVNKTFIVYAKWVKVDESTTPSEDELYQEELTLNLTQVNLKINQTESIYVNSTNPYLEVWYESSNDEVVSVDSDGIIKGLKNGKATIWVYVEDGSVFKCKVGVGTRQYIKSIETNVTAKQVKKGKKYQIETTITPKAVTQKMLSYTSSNKSIATVSSTGVVTAKKKGVCYITVKTKDGTDLKQRVKIRVI